MRTNSERKSAKLEKRLQIEREMKQIVMNENREILRDNIRRRRRREFSVGDRVTVVEWIAGSYSKVREVDRIYRVIEGVVVQVVPGGYFVEGTSSRGKPAKDFINRAHIINGFVKMYPSAGEHT